MRQTLTSLILLTSLTVLSQNPFLPKQETLDAIQKISFLIGEWKGTGWIQMGPQRHSFIQSESISSKVNGTVVQIEGLGKDEKNPDIIVHQAFAIISYDIQNKKYLMKAFRGDGGQIDADANALDNHTLEWGFSNPSTGKIKYTITVLNNTWTEVGEMSRDGGTTWNKYFEMTLTKK